MKQFVLTKKLLKYYLFNFICFKILLCYSISFSQRFTPKFILYLLSITHFVFFTLFATALRYVKNWWVRGKSKDSSLTKKRRLKITARYQIVNESWYSCWHCFFSKLCKNFFPRAKCISIVSTLFFLFSIEKRFVAASANFEWKS